MKATTGYRMKGPQKCTGLIFYKSYLACIKIATEFFIARGEEGAGWAKPNKQKINKKIMHASCTDSSLRHFSPKNLQPPLPKKSHSISEELGDVAGGAHRNEMFVGEGEECGQG